MQPLLIYLEDLLQRWANKLPMTPFERAGFRFLQGVLITAFLSAVTAVGTLITKDPQTPLGTVGQTAFSAFLVSLFFAVWHYLSSRGDAPVIPTGTGGALSPPALLAGDPDGVNAPIPATPAPAPVIPASAAVAAPAEAIPTKN